MTSKAEIDADELFARQLSDDLNADNESIANISSSSDIRASSAGVVNQVSNHPSNHTASSAGVANQVSNHPSNHTASSAGGVNQTFPAGEIAEVDDSIICVICLDDVGGSASALALPCCHTFHRPCIMGWTNTSRTCPVCIGDIGGAAVGFIAHCHLI